MLVRFIIYNIISKFFEIASKVLFSEINTSETLEKYNGLQSFLENTVMIIGPVIGTYLFATFSFNLILIIVSYQKKSQVFLKILKKE